MNKKQALIQLAIAIIVAIIFIIPLFSLRSSQESERLFIPNLDVNKIKKITLKNSNSNVEIELSENGWKVANRGNYPANFKLVRQFLRTITEVKVIRQPETGISQMGRLRLLAPEKSRTKSGTRISFSDSNGVILNSFIIGKRHLSKMADGKYTKGGQIPTGCYVRPDDNSPNVILLDRAFANVSAVPADWLDHSFVTMGMIKSIKVTFKNPADSWELLSEDDKGNMKLQGLKDGEKSALTKISSLVKFFPTPKFTDVITEKDLIQQLNFDTELEIIDMDGFHYRFFLGNEMDDTTICKLKVSFGKPNKKLLDKLKKENTYSKWHYQIPTALIKPFKYKRNELIKPAIIADKNIEVKK